MKDYNFNQLKNIKTPEEWMKKALEIPQKKKTPLIFSYKTYAFVAAVFVCVCAVTVAAMMNFNSDTVVRVSPTSNNSTTHSENSDNNTLPTNATGTYSTEQANTSTILNQEIYITGITGEFQQTTYATNTIRPTTSVLNPSQALLATTVIPYQSLPIQETTIIGENNPTQIATLSPTPTTVPIFTVQPTYVAPTQVVTDPTEKTTNATERPMPSAPCVEPTESTVKPTSPTSVITEPTEDSTHGTTSQFVPYYYIYFQLQKDSKFDINKTLYCRIIDKNGNSLFEKFSDNEKCSVFSESARRFVYKVDITKNSLPYGTYTFVFYDRYLNSSEHVVVIRNEKIINLYE